MFILHPFWSFVKWIINRSEWWTMELIIMGVILECWFDWSHVDSFRLIWSSSFRRCMQEICSVVYWPDYRSILSYIDTIFDREWNIERLIFYNSWFIHPHSKCYEWHSIGSGELSVLDSFIVILSRRLYLAFFIKYLVMQRCRFDMCLQGNLSDKMER